MAERVGRLSTGGAINGTTGGGGGEIADADEARLVRGSLPAGCISVPAGTDGGLSGAGSVPA